jgi:hypothetical protein
VEAEATQQPVVSDENPNDSKAAAVMSTAGRDGAMSRPVVLRHSRTVPGNVR